MTSATRSVVICALFSALLAASAVTAIPTPWGIPLTLQTFVLCLLGFLLPPSLACKTVLVYLLCGAVGLPVFGSMQGGISVLLGPTGGYLWGFLLLVLLCALPLRSPLLRAVFALLGLSLCHCLGAAQAALVAHSSFWGMLATLSLPFFPKDLILMAAARALARPCRRALERSSLLPPQNNK